jgi:hypothetical protein
MKSNTFTPEVEGRHMRTKRSMTITLTCLTIILFTPSSASALAGGAVSLTTLLHDPLFMLLVLVGFLALGGSLIVACVISYRRAGIFGNALGRQLGGGGQYDFSGIETPVEIQALCFDSEKSTALGGDSADTAAFPAVDGHDATLVSAKGKSAKGSPVKDSPAKGNSGILRNLDEFGDPDDFDAQGDLGTTGDEDSDLFDLFEVEEPLERPSMEFTDDMIQQVIAGVERRREAERAKQQREWQAEPLLQAEPIVTLHISVKEKSGQQAAIEWLSTEQKRQGRHFRPAHSRAEGDEVKARGLAEYVTAPMKHSREQQETLYQRVG